MTRDWHLLVADSPRRFPGDMVRSDAARADSGRFTREEHHAQLDQFCRRRLTSLMDFAYRSHTAFVNLDAGESMSFALAPMTAGWLKISIERLSGGGTDYPGDHPPRPGSSPREHVDWNF